jgi:thiol:disulfide interchange protein DsbD
LVVLLCCAQGLAQAPKNVLLDSAPPPQDTDIQPKDVIHWEAMDATSFADGRVTVNLRLTTSQDFTLYDSKVTFSAPPGFVLDEMRAPPTRTLVDPVMDKEVKVYFGGEFELRFIGPKDNIGAKFPVTIKYLGCTSRICLFPYTETIEIPVRIGVNSESQVPVNPQPTTDLKPIESKHELIVKASAPSIGVKLPIESADDDIENTLVKRMKGQNLSLGILLLFAFLGGILTNLTPCVYPMIPITIRVLARQGKSPFLASVAYGSGILVTYTSLGVFASLSGSLFGSIMASPTFNLIFGTIMFLFGLTMIGYGNLSFLQNIGNRLGAGQASVKNAFLMGTGAGFVASPCTGPVLAFFLGYSAKEGDVLKGITLLFTYSLGFALPYVFLGGVAAKAAAIKVSPRVQVGVKTGFAAVMFGLGFYYFRIPAYGLLNSLGEYWKGLTILGLAAGVFAAAVIFLVPSMLNKKGALVAPALLVGLGIFSGSQWISARNETTSGRTLIWLHSEAEALKLAAERHLPVFIDNRAEWCEACKKMEASTFIDERVIEILGSGNWVLLQLDFTETTDENDRLMEKYEIKSLPTLVLLKSGGGLDGKQLILGYVNGAGLVNQIRTFSAE